MMPTERGLLQAILADAKEGVNERVEVPVADFDAFLA